MVILLVMLIMGLILGFAGAGGSGVIIAVLVTLFHVPIHTALGTSVAAMIFTVLAGSYSHFREGNMEMRTGLITGLFGAIGAYVGSHFSTLIPAYELTWITAFLLVISALVIWFKTANANQLHRVEVAVTGTASGFWRRTSLIGSVNGFLSGIAGIGAAPFIQLGLLFVLKMPLRQTVGTTMLVILPIALFGSIGYWQAGYIEWWLLLEVVVGTMVGSFIGAKYTKRVPTVLLRFVLVSLPVLGAFLLLI